MNLGIRDDEFEEAKIKSIIEDKLQSEEDNEEDNEEENEEEDGFNINEQDNVLFILFLYNDFKKQIPPQSKITQTIKRYFTMQNMNNNKKKMDLLEITKKLSQEDQKTLTLSQKIDSISERLKEFYEKYKKENIRSQNLPKLKESIDSSIKILKTSNYSYIPMLGLSNAGKSTILNGLVGCSILPAHKNECTKKGILIKHWENDYPVIRKTKFKKDKLGDEIMYYFKPEENIIAIGLDDIHRVLEGTNGEFTDNTEDYFYEIDINIKFVRESILDENIKNKICFIDLPGFGTNNAFEQNEIYSQLIKSCNIFLFIVFNLKIKENDNIKMLDNLIEKMSSFRGITSKSFVDKCLFIVNCDKDQKINEKSEEQAKLDIQSILSKDAKNSKNNLPLNIKVCFFNAKYYENYIQKLLYYSSAFSLIDKEYQVYLDSQEKFWRGLLNLFKNVKFNIYLKSILEDNLKNDIKKSFNKDIKAKEEIVKEVKDIIKYNSLKFSEKDINLISKYITFGSENINESTLLTESNIKVFRTTLLSSIERAKNAEEKEINSNLKICLKILDDVFEVPPNTKFGPCKKAPIAKVVKPHIEEDLNNMTTQVDKLLKSINNEFANHNIISLFDNYLSKINSTLYKKKNSISKNLESKNYEKVQEDFEDAFKNKSEDFKSQLISNFEESTKNINKYYNKCYDILDKFYSEKCQRECDLFKDYISNKLGGDNDIEETMEQLVDDIIKSSKSVNDWEERKSFFGWVYSKFSDEEYLTNIINFIIDKISYKFKSFRNEIDELIYKYKTKLNREIKSSKDRVVEELEEKKEEEQLEINRVNAKNEEERKKWEEEKRILEEKKKKWEELCKKYRSLRDEITSLRLGGE